MPKMIFIVWCIYIFFNSFLIHDFNIRHCYLIICFLLFLSLTVIFSKHLFHVYIIYRIISAIALCESFVCITQQIGAIQSLNHFFRVTGTQNNPNTTAMFLALSVPATYFLVLREKKRLQILAITALLITFIALFTLKCRTALLGTVIASAILLGHYFNVLSYFKSKRNRISGILIILLSIGITIPIISKTYHFKEASADTRITVWKIALQMVDQKPLIGYGYGHFEKDYNLFRVKLARHTRDVIITRAGYVNMAYNELIENAIEGGIIGGLLFLGVLVSLLVIGYNSNYSNHINVSKRVNTWNKVKFVPAAAIVTFAVMSMVNFTIQAISVMCLFILYAAILTTTSQMQQRTNKPIVEPCTFLISRKIMTLFIGLIMIVLSSYLTISQISYMSGHLAFKRAMQLFQNGDKISALQKMQQLEDQLKRSDLYYQQYGWKLVHAGKYSEAFVKLNKATGFTTNANLYLNLAYCCSKLGYCYQAIQYYNLDIQIEPVKFTPRYRLMKLYEQLGDTINMIQTAMEIVDLKLKVPSREITFYKNEAMKMIRQNKKIKYSIY